MRIEHVNRQKFIGFVNQLIQLQNPGILEGNAYQQGRLHYRYADLDDFARSSGLKNKKQASIGVIERLQEKGHYNERHGQRYDVQASMTE